MNSGSIDNEIKRRGESRTKPSERGRQRRTGGGGMVMVECHRPQTGQVSSGGWMFGLNNCSILLHCRVSSKSVIFVLIVVC